MTYLKLRSSITRRKTNKDAKSKDMITNSDFNFKKNELVTLELPFSEHIEELRQRIFHIFWIILVLTCLVFF